MARVLDDYDAWITTLNILRTRYDEGIKTVNDLILEAAKAGVFSRELYWPGDKVEEAQAVRTLLAIEGYTTGEMMYNSCGAPSFIVSWAR